MGGTTFQGGRYYLPRLVVPPSQVGVLPSQVGGYPLPRQGYYLPRWGYYLLPRQGVLPSQVGVLPSQVGVLPSQVRGYYLPRWGTPSPDRSQARGYPLPEQHSVYLLRGGRYASCVHAGGLSCAFQNFRIVENGSIKPPRVFFQIFTSHFSHLPHKNKIAYQLRL